MQILREALLQKLSTSIILFKVLRNKILCLTQYQLILLNIDQGCKKVQIPYPATNVWAIEMSKDYIAILQRSGNLEIRRLDNIKQVILIQTNVKLANQKYPKLKWWEDDLHIVYEKKYDEISIPNKQLTFHSLPFEVKLSQNLIQLEFCDLFPGLKCIFYIMTSSIHMFLNGVKLGLIQLEDQQIKQVLKLCHPLQANQFKKQYLVILTQTLEQNKDAKKTFLKVYNILNMELIFSRELYKQKDQQIQISCDQLCQYLLVKYYKGKSSIKNLIQSQNLMKVNGDYYYSGDLGYFQSNESFFCFDIVIGLKKNLKLFPSHSEKIKGKLCNSIDTCYYEKNQIFIASIVLEASYKDQIFNNYQQIQIVKNPEPTNYYIAQSDIIIWQELVEAKICPNSLIDKILKSISLRSSRPELETYFSLQIGIEQQKIIQNLLSSLNKINQFTQNDLNKAYLTIKKIITIEYFPMLLDVASIERDQNKTSRQIMQKSNEDFVNTMSGFSSSQPHSPRSIKSQQSQKQGQFILKDISKDLSSKVKTHQDDDLNSCHQCDSIEDHENLQLIASIEDQNSMKTQQFLIKIQEQIHKMETLCKYRLEKMEMKTRREKKTQKNVSQLIENEFKSSLNAIEVNLMNSAKEFTAKLAKRTELMAEKQRSACQYVQKLEDYRLNHENELKIHKDNKDELLDYLYDIEFPDLGMENYQPGNFNSPFNNSVGSSSVTRSVNKTIPDLNLRKEESEDFKLFSDFILKNFI